MVSIFGRSCRTSHHKIIKRAKPRASFLPTRRAARGTQRMRPRGLTGWAWGVPRGLCRSGGQNAVDGLSRAGRCRVWFGFLSSPPSDDRSGRVPLRSRPGHDVEGRSRDGLVGALHLGTLGRSQFVFPVYAYRTPKKTILSNPIRKRSWTPGKQIVQQCVDAT